MTDALRWTEPFQQGPVQPVGLRIALVVSRFNELVTERLLAGAKAALLQSGLREEDIPILQVPGALEIPFACQEAIRTLAVDATVALGCVIRGETAHFDLVAEGSAAGLREVSLQWNRPVLNAILAVDTLDQALDRAGGKGGNRGRDGALAAVEMASLTRDLQAYRAAAEAVEAVQPTPHPASHPGSPSPAPR